MLERYPYRSAHRSLPTNGSVRSRRFRGDVKRSNATAPITVGGEPATAGDRRARRDSVRGHSLRRRLLIGMLAGFAFLSLVAALLLWTYARTAADRTYDPLLAGAALAILERGSVAAEGPTVDLPQAALDLLALAPDERIAYAVLANGETLTALGTMPPPPETGEGAGPTFFESEIGGAPMRIVSQTRRLAGASGPVDFEVRIAQTTSARDAEARALFARGMVGLAFVSLLGALCVWLAIDRTLRPLRALERQLDRRRVDDTAPIDVAVPHEVRGLTDALNGFVRRLAEARGRTETFIADVAHQTRTSLSALDGQIALAADAPDEAAMRRRLQRAERQSRRTIRLTNQLLAHAMVQHRAADSERQDFDLDRLVRDLLAGMLRDTELRERSITFEGGEPVPTRGDPISVREAVRNLIENALRHGPSEGEIVVRVRRGEGAEVSVSDSGPGIPPHERERAVARFQSLDPERAGSGLGLAIVSAVASAHRGTLELDRSEGGGLRATLRLATLLLVALTILPLLTGTAEARERALHIWSATDEAAMRPVLEAFADTDRGIEIVYRDFQTVDLHAAILAAGDRGPDVVISSAMDLQIDLVNRGLARPLPTVRRVGDERTRWRGELFGFTFEPAAVIYDREAFAGDELPRNHAALSDFVRDREASLRGRVATYDIRLSGVGYLFATQDVGQGVQALRLAETLGRTGVRVFCCTSRMADAVARGEISFAFNVIGSYALAAARGSKRIGVHLFEDYNLVMTRSAFVPRTAPDPELGERFVAFLLSPAGQGAIARAGALLPLDTPRGVAGIPQTAPLNPIPLGPQLLTYLDRVKRDRFLGQWSSAMQIGP